MLLFIDLLIKKTQRIVERSKIAAHKAGKAVALVFNNHRQDFPDLSGSLAHDNAIFAEQPSGLVYQRGARADIPLPDSMNALNFNLFRRLMRHKTHIWTLHSFAYGGCIVGVVFRAQKIGFHISRMNAPHCVPQAFNLPGPVLR